MTDDINPIQALHFIKTNAPLYAAAKGRRIYIENYLKSIKAILMAEVKGDGKKEVSLGAKEQYAYSHEKYQQQLQALETAVQDEEKLKYLLEASKLAIEVYKANEYTKRTEMKNLDVS